MKNHECVKKGPVEIKVDLTKIAKYVCATVTILAVIKALPSLMKEFFVFED